MGEEKKRKHANDQNDDDNKKKRKSHQYKFSAAGIVPGTQGVFVTCHRGHEDRCVGELYSMFDEFYHRLWPAEESEEEVEEDEEDDETVDIEDSIKAELGQLKAKKVKRPFYSVKMSQECVCFMVTRPPIEPVRLVHEICLDALAGNKRSRTAQRFTPIQSTCYATLADFRVMCEKVLGPIFNAENVDPIKYAIRPNVRDNQSMKRDLVIATVGSVIGRDHIVDLKNYDVLILVETVKNITGISVVRDFDKLKRFNVEQLYEQYQITRDKQSGKKPKSEYKKDVNFVPNGEKEDEAED